jgi:cell division protein FtsI/penicillin-binding protein 2
VSRRAPNRRIRLLLVLFTLAFAATFGRAVRLQAVNAQGLDRLAEGQHHATVTVPAPRGAMIDRNACGRMIIRSDWVNVSPIERAASACPTPTALMPDRTASQKKAAW